jgi:hypothetical protein
MTRMTKKIYNVQGKIDLHIDSDTEYFGNGHIFQVAVHNRKEQAPTPILKDTNKITVEYVMQKLRVWKRAQREKQARREARLKM